MRRSGVARCLLVALLGIVPLHPLRGQGHGHASPPGGVRPQALPCPDCPPPSDTLPIVTIVSPSATVYTRTPLTRVTFQPGGTGPYDAASLSSVTWGGVNVTTLGRYNGRLFEWEVAPAYQLGAGGSSKDLVATVCNLLQHCTTRTLTVTLASSPYALLSVTTMPLEALGRRATAGLGGGFAIHGAEVVTGVTTPGYVSWDAPHATGLTYSSRQSYPRALVYADLEFPGGLPTSLTVKLRDFKTVVSQFTQANPSCSSGGQPRCRVALVANYVGSTGGAQITRKRLWIEVVATIGGVAYSSVDTAEVVIVDRRTTPYGSGWWPSGVFRLATDGSDAILVGSDGSATIFRGYQNQYISPPGDYSTLLKTASGWELQFRGGGKLVFDSQGRQTEADGSYFTWRTLISYLSTDQVDRITDPAGKYFQFAYTGGILSGISDIGGRTSLVTVTSGQLTRFVPAGIQEHRQDFAWNAYANSAVLPNYSADWLNERVTLGYSGDWPQRVIGPGVQDEYGAWVQPDGWYLAAELKGLNGIASLDTVYARAVDARGNWTHSTMNRWGDALRAWDAVGTLGVNTYGPYGQLLTSEGKVGDSTRVFVTYDVLGHRVSTRRTHGATTVRVDSLVWDIYHRVSRQYGMLNTQYTDYTYTSWGSVVGATSSFGDATVNSYNGPNGRLDSRQVSGTQGVTRVWYNTAWGNTDSVQTPDGITSTRNTYDSLGRLTEARSRITVRATSGSTDVQWRRWLTFYGSTGLVDSVRTERTASCPSPCTTPSWPAPDDSMLTRTTRTTHDVLGRPLSILGAYNYVLEQRSYDSLGRLASMGRPNLAGTIVVERYQFDRAGNPRFRTTRRGHVIETQYDSRNRPTRRIIPTVGTFDLAYAGPNDELTAVTAQAGYADPVGGSNVNAGWAYDQSGRLLSETVQGNRTTTYGYDAYDRVSSLTDATGGSQVLYNAQRGTPDTLVTPFGDRVVYSIDSQGRLNGPTVVTGLGWSFGRGQVWRDQGGLRQLRNDVGGTGAFAAGVETLADTDPLAAYDSLSPAWAEAQGAGGASHNMVDSLQFDGWERVSLARYLRDGAVSSAQAFRFDRGGNLTIDPVPGSPENWYFGTTAGNQLWHAGECGIDYDDAGNMRSKGCPVAGSTYYTYDALDRLTNVQTPNGTQVAYTYDALGQRIAKSVGGVVTRFVWRGGHVMYETDGAGTLARSYTWGSGEDDLVAIQDHQAGQRYYVVQDELRTVRGLVRRDAAGGTWMAAWRYTMYGQQLVADGGVSFPVRFRWAGAQYDEETGLYFMRTRFYEPEYGRFIQEDAAGYAGGGNLYAYAGGNPADRRDPDGMRSIPEPQYQTDEGLNAMLHAFGGGGFGGSGEDLSDWMDDLDAHWDEVNEETIETVVRQVTDGQCSSGRNAKNAICYASATTYAESWNDPKEQLGVANVILNRASSTEYFGFVRTGIKATDVISAALSRQFDVVRFASTKWVGALNHLWGGVSLTGGALGEFTSAVRAVTSAYLGIPDNTRGSHFFHATPMPQSFQRQYCGGRQPYTIRHTDFC